MWNKAIKFFDGVITGLLTAIIIAVVALVTLPYVLLCLLLKPLDYIACKLENLKSEK